MQMNIENHLYDLENVSERTGKQARIKVEKVLKSSFNSLKEE